MTTRIRWLGFLSVFLLWCSGPAVWGEDWPEWRGRGRLGVWGEEGILERFPSGGLQVKWRTAIGSGYAGPAVAEGRVFVLDYRKDPQNRTLEGVERLLCLEETSGRILWTHEWQTSYRRLMATYPIGPRATPTVDGGRVYVVGATGVLRCLNAEEGSLLWEKDYVRDYGTSVPVWGVTGAPLVAGRPGPRSSGRWEGRASFRSIPEACTR